MKGNEINVFYLKPRTNAHVYAIGYDNQSKLGNGFHHAYTIRQDNLSD